MKRIKIFDTTLRDGEQSPGCSMNLAEKIEMAKQLEKLGVDIIEAGFAIASPLPWTTRAFRPLPPLWSTARWSLWPAAPRGTLTPPGTP